MPTTDAVLVLTTLPASADVSAFAGALVEARLAACVSALPAMDSIYRWKETIERDAERQLLIKTRPALVDRLFERIRSMHPYEVPELLVLPVTGGGAPYLAWLSEVTAVEDTAVGRSGDRKSRSSSSKSRGAATSGG